MKALRVAGWLAFTVGCVLASMPVWRPLLFPRPVTIDDVLAFRCG